jgi:hypothetical protein
MCQEPWKMFCQKEGHLSEYGPTKANNLNLGWSMPFLNREEYTICLRKIRRSKPITSKG